MTLDEIKAHQWAYFTAPMIAADLELRHWLDLPADMPVPLSISHGVELGQYHFPQDVKAPEPLHWSYNPIITERARAYKPVIELPHPFLMRAAAMNLPKGKGQLVVGPPPGPENDGNLHALIADRAGKDTTILVKPRGNWRPSADFWNARGFGTITATASRDGYFAELASIIAGAERVVGVTFSSVLLFAAAIGREIELIPGLQHRSIEGMSYLDEVDIRSPAMREIVATFLSGDQARVGALSRQLLGAEFLEERATKRDELMSAIAKLRSPLWFDPDVRFPPRALRYWLARATKRPGFVNIGPRQIAARLRKDDLALMEVNELEMWIDGPSDDNFRLTPLSDPNERRRAGAAAIGYPS